MPNTIEDALAYARTHPTRDGGTWHNWCESFIWRAGGFAGSFDDAWLAARASGWLNPDHASAPRGSIHYWSNSGYSPGHVAFGLGNDQLLMASNGVTTRFGGDIGTASWAEYRRNKPAMTYAGWTMRHGTQTLAGSSAAAGDVTPIVILKKEVIPMARYIRNAASGTIALTNIDTGMWVELSDPAYVTLLDARGMWDRSKDLNVAPNEYDFFKSIAAGVRGAVDTTAIARAVVAGLGAQVTGGVDIAKLAAAVDAVLSDNFAALPSAVNDNAAARMKE